MTNSKNKSGEARKKIFLSTFLGKTARIKRGDPLQVFCELGFNLAVKQCS